MTTATKPQATHHDDALLICCALAWHGNPLMGNDYDPHHIERTVTIARCTHTPNQLLRWRTHTAPASWGLRWRWADHVTRTLYPHATGLETLPTDHHDLPTEHTTP